MIEIELKKMNITSEIPITYHHLNSGPDKPVLIFFHGYSDSARAFLRRSYPDMNEKYEILAINGLFPVPQKKDNEWKQAFAWYFADFTTKSVLIHPEISAKAVVHLLEKLNLQNREKVLIGFSQGGFFIPFIWSQLKKVKYILAIGAAYREQDYKKTLEVPMDALHGDEDDIISYTTAETSFKDFVQKKNPSGKFYGFKGLKHTMNNDSRLWLKNIIDEVLK